MYFDTYGPFEIERSNGRVPPRQPQFWEDVRRSCKEYGFEPTDLERAIGCYAFGLRHGDSITPWYVGMTLAEKGFRGEVFQPHKRDHYDAVVSERRGQPIMFLMPLLTPEGRFSHDRSSNKALIQWVEKMLFGVALRRNLDCRNQRDTKFLRNVKVSGVFNSRPRGRSGPEVTAVRQMFGIEAC